MDKKEITNSELLESINGGFSKIEEKMATDLGKVKIELLAFKLETNTHFNNLESDLRSFKEETRDNFSELNEKVDDVLDTSQGYDKRIEALEIKV